MNLTKRAISYAPNNQFYPKQVSVGLKQSKSVINIQKLIE